MDKVKKVAGWVATAIFLLIIAGLAFIYFTPGYSFSLVKSGSMTPSIGVGDMIVTRPVSQGAIQPGVIVMYARGTELITHRVVSVNGDVAVTKGDALEHADSWTVTRAELRGIYVFKIPLIGYFINFAHTKIGWFVAIIIPAMLIIGLFIKDILKETFKNEKKAANGSEVKSITEQGEEKKVA